MPIKTLLSNTLMITAFLFIAAVVMAAGMPAHPGDVVRISADELQRLRTNQEIVIIDTRTPGQWHRAEEKIPGAIRFTFSDDIQNLKAQVPYDRTIVTYCS